MRKYKFMAQNKALPELPQALISDMSQSMSAQSPASKKLTVPSFRARKNETKLVVLTAYSAPMAKLLAPHVDALLIGDSLGMVLYGFDSTLPVTLDMMARHTEAVRRGAPDTFLIADLPFGSYQSSKEQAFESSAVLLRSGADAVKLEGGVVMAETISFLTARGVPVMGHIGLMPQSINQLGSYKAQGRDAGSAGTIKEDALAVEKAGAFSYVIEGIAESLAREITMQAKIPTIGIGASAFCDGQVLVTDDLLGIFSDFKPKFVRRYAELAPQISKAVAGYAEDVRDVRFPSDKESF